MTKELKMGIKIESEHKDTYDFIKQFYKKHKRFPTQKEVYKKIAKDHIKEDPKYYTKIKKYGLWKLQI